jgi:hypothetical protein
LRFARAIKQAASQLFQGISKEVGAGLVPARIAKRLQNYSSANVKSIIAFGNPGRDKPCPYNYSLHFFSIGLSH